MKAFKFLPHERVRIPVMVGAIVEVSLRVSDQFKFNLGF